MNERYCTNCILSDTICMQTLTVTFIGSYVVLIVRNLYYLNFHTDKIGSDTSSKTPVITRYIIYLSTIIDFNHQTRREHTMRNSW